MRYINKADRASAILTNFIRLQRNAGVNPLYNDFRDAEQLNNLLRTEQRNICCYCQQKIDHYHGDNIGGSHNEHLEPQHGDYANPERQLDYYNIFACCNYSKGKIKNLQHCGEYKGQFPITNFISNPACRAVFRYNVIGEILPAHGAYNKESDFILHRDLLTYVQQNALDTITTLNLNCPTLKHERKNNIAAILPLIGRLSYIQAQQQIQVINNARILSPFTELIIHYLQQVTHK